MAKIRARHTRYKTSHFRRGMAYLFVMFAILAWGTLSDALDIARSLAHSSEPGRIAESTTRSPPNGLADDIIETLFVLTTVVVMVLDLYPRWARMRRCGWAICLECGDDLSEEPAQGRCPRCGTQYDIEHVRAAWNRPWGESARGATYNRRTQLRILRSPYILSAAALLVLVPVFIAVTIVSDHVADAAELLPLIYATVITVALLAALEARWTIRTLRRMKQANWAICLECGDDLSEEPAQGRCPRCGTQYDIEHVRAAWKRTR